MASCEKCWEDAFYRSMVDAFKSKSEHYSDLIKERKDNPCTPEEQAGEEAEICKECNRQTVHQYIHVCMNPDCKLYHKDMRGEK
jgi:hypothetical protein